MNLKCSWVEKEINMIVNMSGVEQPPVCSANHWEMFRVFCNHPDLYNPLRDAILKGIENEMMKPDPYIDSRRLGAKVLDDLSSWWHGEFPRRFNNFPIGADRGIFGMTLWNCLAKRQDWWIFTEQEDPHGYGENSMLYSKLPDGHKLIPRKE